MARLLLENFERSSYDNSGWTETVGTGNIVESANTDVTGPSGNGVLKTELAGTNANAYTVYDLGSNKAVVYFTTWLRVGSDSSTSDTNDIAIASVSGVVNNVNVRLRYTPTRAWHIDLRRYSNGDGAIGDLDGNSNDNLQISTDTWYRVGFFYDGTNNVVTGYLWDADGNVLDTATENIGLNLRTDSRYVTVGTGTRTAGLELYFDAVQLDDSEWPTTPVDEPYHNLTADDLVTGSPVLSSPAISQIHGLSATGISTGSPVLGSPSLGGVVELAANDLVSNAPVSGTPAISQGHSISATGIITGSPVVGTPAPDQGHSLTANSVVSGAPIIPSPAIGQVHTLESGDLETCQPVLGSPTLSTEGSHSLEADGVVTGDPVSGTPEISQSHSIGAPVQITTGSPSVGTPAISQRSSLSANSVVSGAPVLSDPALSQNHSITPTILLSGAPDLGSPGLSTEGVHSLTAVGIIVTPDISETAITQNHGLVPTPVTAGAPAIGTPELTIGVTSVSLTATGIITGSPALEFPAITQTHDIAPVGFVTGVPDIGEAAFPGGTVQVRIWIRRS
jgi:hypothetical protein